MNPGFLHAAAALDLISKMQDAHAQNLANANTSGYRKRISSAEAFSNALKSASGLVLPQFRESIDFSQGTLQSTGESLDVGIDGKGFFAIETARGERYTRSGAFSLDEQGYLVNVDGEKVMGDRGPIQLDPGQGKPTIDDDGNVRQGTQSVGRLKIVEFPKTEDLIAENGGQFRAPEGVVPETASNTRVRQSHLEQSNVDVVDELVQMISGFRSFEAAQRTLVGLDRVRSQAISGR